MLCFFYLYSFVTLVNRLMLQVLGAKKNVFVQMLGVVTPSLRAGVGLI